MTRSVVPLVTAGMEVEKGDILVEGGVPIYNDDGSVKRYDFCRANADIMLRCIYEMQEEMEEKYEQKQYTGRERKYPFILFGSKKLGIPPIGSQFDQSDAVEEKTQLCLFNNYYLPVYVGYDFVREYTTEEKTYKKE